MRRLHDTRMFSTRQLKGAEFSQTRKIRLTKKNKPATGQNLPTIYGFIHHGASTTTGNATSSTTNNEPIPYFMLNPQSCMPKKKDIP